MNPTGLIVILAFGLSALLAVAIIWAIIALVPLIPLGAWALALAVAIGLAYRS